MRAWRAVCRMAERKIHVPGGSILAHHASEALQSRELRVAVDVARTLSFSCFVCTAMISLSKVMQAFFCVSRSYVYIYILHLSSTLPSFFLFHNRNGRILDRCRFYSSLSQSGSSHQRCCVSNKMLQLKIT